MTLLSQQRGSGCLGNLNVEELAVSASSTGY